MNSNPIAFTVIKETEYVRMAVILAPILFLVLGGNLVEDFYERTFIVAIMQTFVAAFFTRSKLPFVLTVALSLGHWQASSFGVATSDFERLSGDIVRLGEGILIPMSIAMCTILALLGQVPSTLVCKDDSPET